LKLTKYIETLKTHPDFRDAFVYHRYLPARPAVYGPEVSFHDDILETMKHAGIDRLYSHQVKAIEHLRHGANVLVATPTASGKSLIYNLMVLEEILEHRDARALYVFPLKALEQDQFDYVLYRMGHLRIFT